MKSETGIRRFDIQFFAHKKGQGSSSNGRDSNPQYLGIKRSDGQIVTPERSSSASAAQSSTPGAT